MRRRADNDNSANVVTEVVLERSDRQIVAINLSQSLVLWDDGTVGEITVMLDSEGDETTDINEAYAIVGPVGSGMQHYLDFVDRFNRAPH